MEATMRDGSSAKTAAGAGLRTVAALEAAKGVLVLVAGLGLLSLVHRDAQRAAETVVFGEKLPMSPHGDFYMDLLGGAYGNDFEELDQGRHGGRTGSNYAFADGGVRFLKPWQSLGPGINQWAVIPEARVTYAVKR